MIIFRTKKINFLTIEKTPRKMGRLRTLNEQNEIKSSVPISIQRGITGVIILPFSLESSLKLRAYTE